jgi:hypothetical protein
MDTEMLATAPPGESSFRFRATDITGTLEMEVEDLQASVPAGAVARTLAHRMELPTDVPWTLRDERGAYLDEEGQIGAQLQSDARVVLTPKTHLG